MAELYYKTYTTNIQQFMRDAILFLFALWRRHSTWLGTAPRLVPFIHCHVYAGCKKTTIFFNFGPFWVFRTCSKVVQKGPKGTKIVITSVFDQLVPFWDHHFKQNLFFCSAAPPPNPTFSILGKKSFLSEMVQKGPDGPKQGPKWSKRLRLTILVPFGPFWTPLERWQACHVWPFLVQNGPFLGTPESWTVDPNVEKKV